ncbi:MAG TPA: response regulator [Dehalococcoidia bacterium]|jgi:DNA-binding NtrC family response regulator
MKEEPRQIHIRIPEELYRKLKVRCVYEDTSIQDHVLKIIAQSMGQPTAGEGSVLIVEDEAVVRESLRDWLKDIYQVVMAETGEEALDLIGKQDFDVLIVDVRLPGKSGLQVLSEVRETKPYIKCIVITAYPSVELAVEAMKLGAVDYLIKPVAPERLERLMRDTLFKGKTANIKKAADVRELDFVGDKAATRGKRGGSGE